MESSIFLEGDDDIMISREDISCELLLGEDLECISLFLELLGLLKLLSPSVIIHPRLDTIEDRLSISAEKSPELSNMILMCRNRRSREKAGSRTETDIVVHAWRSFSGSISDDRRRISLLSKVHLATSDTKDFFEKPQTLMDARSLGIRTKILGTIGYLLPCFVDFCDRRMRYFDVGEILIILHQDIVLWRKMFDQIRLEHEGLYFGLTEDHLDVSDLFDHLRFCSTEDTLFSEI